MSNGRFSIMDLSKQQILHIIESVTSPDYGIIFNLPTAEQKFLRDLEDVTGKILLPGYNCKEYRNHDYLFIPNSYLPKNIRAEIEGDAIIYLCLTKMDWEDLPASVHDLKYLRKIWLADNRIMEFPERIKNLGNNSPL